MGRILREALMTRSRIINHAFFWITVGMITAGVILNATGH